MKVAYFDCTFGAAGDMLTAALLHAGVPRVEWEAELKKINLPPDSFHVNVETVLRCAIQAVKFSVDCLGPSGSYEREIHSQEHDHDHEHKHAHHHAHHHHHHHHHHHVAKKKHTHGRSYSEILELIDRSEVLEPARNLARAIFRNLAEAESRVHGVDVDSIHFHEVGAIDAIVDVISFSVAYSLLGIERSVVSPLTVGSGTIKTAHGNYMIPAPAVSYLLESSGAPISSVPLTFECLTPTGAAILATIADSWGAMPAFSSISGVGYGAGHLNPDEHPNVVRVFLGQSTSSLEAKTGYLEAKCDEFQLDNADMSWARLERDLVTVIEANIDDCSPDILANAMSRCFAAGALDVTISPALMKKGRAGQLFSIIASPQDSYRLARILMEETTTIGVRTWTAERMIARREFREIEISGESVRIKISSDKDGRILNLKPEYDDCLLVSQSLGLSLKSVYEEAISKCAHWKERQNPIIRNK